MRSPIQIFKHLLPAALIFLAASCASVPETEEDRLNKAPTEFASPEVETSLNALSCYAQMKDVKSMSWESVTRQKDKNDREYETVWAFFYRFPGECFVKQTVNGKPGAAIYYLNGALLYRPDPNGKWRKDQMACSALELMLALIVDPSKAANQISRESGRNTYLLKLRPKYSQGLSTPGSVKMQAEEIRLVFSKDGMLEHREDLVQSKTVRYTDYSGYISVNGKRFPSKVYSGSKQAKGSLEIRNIKINHDPGQLFPPELTED